MWRRIRSGNGGRPKAPRYFKTVPPQLIFPRDEQLNRVTLSPAIKHTSSIKKGAALLEGDTVIHHAPLSGIVDISETAVSILCDEKQGQSTTTLNDDMPLEAYAKSIGLVGMGGSMFPGSIKLAAAKDVHTLVINCVECEPGIEIDEALLLHHTEEIVRGISSLCNQLPIQKVVLAVKKSSASHLTSLAQKQGWKTLTTTNYYPGGAEKLLVGKLEKRTPPATTLPYQLGYLVMSVASLWALGKSKITGSPITERPLSLNLPDVPPHNIIAPVGLQIQEIFQDVGFIFEPETHLLVAGGPMMGHAVTPASPILKGTNAITVVPKKKRLLQDSSPCIRCGSCFDACPLGLHPTSMAKRVDTQKRSLALEAQLYECFLCGACSAVCPADIPLVHTFKRGKQWLRNNK